MVRGANIMNGRSLIVVIHIDLLSKALDHFGSCETGSATKGGKEASRLIILLSIVICVGGILR